MLPLHERIVNESQLHYNAMQLGPIQLLRAREQQIETGAAYVEALRDYWLARTELAQLLSGRLPAGRRCASRRGGCGNERALAHKGVIQKAIKRRGVSWIKRYHGDKYSASALRP